MRCYNGCPDSELKALLDEQSRVRQQIIDAGYSVTWFPNGEFFMAFKDNRGATKECSSLHEVAKELRL